MTDEELLDALAEKADLIAEDMGFDPDGPPEQFNYESGREFGKRLVELWPEDAGFRDRILRRIAREVLEGFLQSFPKSFDQEAFEFQAYWLGPLVSKFITGRGLTVPQLARLAGVTPEHLYRLKRAGLSILFEEEDLPAVSGVNRRYSGLDGRQTHLAVDFKGITTKKWPEPIAFVQRFLLGILDGARTWVETPKYRTAIEASLKRTLPDLFVDPSLGDLFDGSVAAVLRIAQRLRDEILVMKSEKDKAQKLLDTVAEIANRRAAVLATLAQAGAAIGNEPSTLPAGGSS